VLHHGGALKLRLFVCASAMQPQALLALLKRLCWNA